MEFEVGVGQVILLNMSAPGRVAKVTAVSPWAVAAVVYRELPALRWSEETGFPSLELDPSPDDDPEIVAVDPGTFWGWISQHVAYTGIFPGEFDRSIELLLPKIPQITGEQWQQLFRHRGLERWPARISPGSRRARRRNEPSSRRVR